MPRSLRPQSDHVALAALAVLAVVFWGNCLWGGKVPVAAVYQQQMLPWSAVSQAGGETRQWDSLLWDSMAQFYPWRLLLHNAAKQGELPLWNPYQFCGYPFVGNGQSAMFYPPNWLYFVVHPKLGMGLSAALHYFLGSFFVFGLARRWRLGPIPATFAAVAFTYGGFMVTWIELPTLVNSLIWLPLAWWGIEVIVRPPPSKPFPPEGPATSRSAVRGTLMLATALGMTLLAGHFQIAAYVWIFAALYALLRLLGLAVARDARRTRRLLAATGVAVALAAMLAMTQLLPTLELGGLSARGAGKPSAAGFEFHRQRAVQPMELLGLLQADFLGTPVDGSYKGISYSEHCPYVGATTILLGLVGLALGWRRKHLWLFLGIAIFALWGAMAGPPAMLLYWGVPKLGQAGGFSRLLSVWTLAAALWGGAGLQVLLDRLTASLGPTVGRGLVPRRPLSATPEDGAVQARAPQKSTAVPIAVALLALLLLAAELLPWAYRFNPRADAATVYPETEAIRKLRGMTAESRYLAVNDRRIWGLAAVPAGVVLPPNAGTVYGLRCVDGYDSLFPLAYRQYAAELEGADPSPLANGNMLLLGDWPAWTNSAVTVSVFAADDSPPKGSMDSTIEGTVLSAFALGSPRSAVRFSVPTQGWAGRTSHRDVLFGRRARVDDLNHVRVGIKSPYGVQPPSGLKSGAELWQADTFYPGWRCYVDGAERVLGTYAGTPGKTAVFRRVALQPHDRVADFVYYPASVAAGLFVTLLALAALTALGTSALWRHRA